MGKMYFPDEKIREYLPPRESGGDCVARFGAWLTNDGALYISCVLVYVIPALLGIIQLILWIIHTFQKGSLLGFLSIIGACCAAYYIGIIGFYVLMPIVWIIWGIIWLFGWVCYNKWTFFAWLIFMGLCYLIFFVIGFASFYKN